MCRCLSNESTSLWTRSLLGDTERRQIRPLMGRAQCLLIRSSEWNLNQWNRWTKWCWSAFCGIIVIFVQETTNSAFVGVNALILNSSECCHRCRSTLGTDFSCCQPQPCILIRAWRIRVYWRALVCFGVCLFCIDYELANLAFECVWLRSEFLGRHTQFVLIFVILLLFFTRNLQTISSREFNPFAVAGFGGIYRKNRTKYCSQIFSKVNFVSVRTTESHKFNNKIFESHHRWLLCWLGDHINRIGQISGGTTWVSYSFWWPFSSSAWSFTFARRAKSSQCFRVSHFAYRFRS